MKCIYKETTCLSPTPKAISQHELNGILNLTKKIDINEFANFFSIPLDSFGPPDMENLVRVGIHFIDYMRAIEKEQITDQFNISNNFLSFYIDLLNCQQFTDAYPLFIDVIIQFVSITEFDITILSTTFFFDLILNRVLPLTNDYVPIFTLVSLILADNEIAVISFENGKFINNFLLSYEYYPLELQQICCDIFGHIIKNKKRTKIPFENEYRANCEFMETEIFVNEKIKEIEFQPSFMLELIKISIEKGYNTNGIFFSSDLFLVQDLENVELIDERFVLLLQIISATFSSEDKENDEFVSTFDLGIFLPLMENEIRNERVCFELCKTLTVIFKRSSELSTQSQNYSIPVFLINVAKQQSFMVKEAAVTALTELSQCAAPLVLGIGYVQLLVDFLQSTNDKLLRVVMNSLIAIVFWAEDGLCGLNSYDILKKEFEEFGLVDSLNNVFLSEVSIECHKLGHILMDHIQNILNTV